MTQALPTFLLLCCSNVFMTIAWYGHLRFPDTKLWVVVLASWAIAGFEYWFAVPANRIGHANGLSGGQLKIMQECITLVVFAVFATLVLKEPMTWRYAGAGLCVPGRRRSSSWGGKATPLFFAGAVKPRPFSRSS